MARPLLTEIARFHSTGSIAKELGIHRDTLVRRINAGLYPPPTMVNDYGVLFFSDKWLEKVKKDHH